MLVATVHAGNVRRDHDPVGKRSEVPRAMIRRMTQGSTRTPVVGRIIGAATEAVADVGLEGLSMDDVAERAGCSRATVYRRVGGKDALLDAVLDETIDRVNASVARAVEHLVGDERIISAIVASLDMIRADPVSAALLTGPAAGQSVSSELIAQVTGTVASMSGLDAGDGTGCELITRLTLSLLCWPPSDRSAELDIIRRFVEAPGPSR